MYTVVLFYVAHLPEINRAVLRINCFQLRVFSYQHVLYLGVMRWTFSILIKGLPWYMVVHVQN